MIIPENTCTKKLIISLIKDDLLNTKLIYTFQDIGIDAGEYTLHLSETIFELMGFTDAVEHEPIFAHYYELSRRVRYFASTSANLDALALEIYTYLDAMQPEAIFSS